MFLKLTNKHNRIFCILKRKICPSFLQVGGPEKDHLITTKTVVLYFLAAGFLAAFFAAGFFAAGFLATGFLAAGFLAAFFGLFLAAGFAAFGFLAAGFLAAFLAAAFLGVLTFLAFLAAGFFSFLGLSALGLAASLKDPLIWTRDLSSTDFFRNRRMNGP